MKKMKEHEPQHCSWCQNKASWRSSGCDKGKYACSDHKGSLESYERDNKRKRLDDGYMSEGDWQAYGRYGY